MQHTRCGLTDVDDDELRARTGADLEFLAIDDHGDALQADIDILTSKPYLSAVKEIAGLIYDVETGKADHVHRWSRETST
jgi:hypothetical protein